MCLGLEVVTPQGELWDGLRGLRKDNTGYDLRDLFIGAEGTLGIITAAVLKLHPQPAARVTALAALASPYAALDFLSLTQRIAGPLLTGFELMSDFCLRLVGRHFEQMRYPFAEPHAQVVLLELSDSESEAHARGLFERLMETALEEGLVQDAVVAENLASRVRSGICATHSARPGRGRAEHQARYRGADFAHRPLHREDRRGYRAGRARRAHGDIRASRRRQSALQRAGARGRATRKRFSSNTRARSTRSSTTACTDIAAASARNTGSAN